MIRSDVFLSYRRADKEFTQKLDRALKNAGLEVWVDWEDIPPGSVDFTQDIRDGIDGADVFLAVLTPLYLDSPYTMGELDMAIQANKRVIPIVLKMFDVDRIPDEIRHVNWVYFIPHVGEENTFEEAFPRLMEAIHLDQEHVQTHTRLFLSAREWEEANRNASYLLQGDAIHEAEMWMAESREKEPPPSKLHAEYIFTSRNAATNRQRRLLASVTLAFIVSLGLTVLSAFLYRDARNNAAIAERERANALTQQEQAQSLLWANYALQEVGFNNALLAIPLALAANQIDNPPALSQRALAEAAYSPGPRRLYEIPDTHMWSATLSPDETRVVAGDAEGTVTVWAQDAPAAPLWSVNGHEGSVWQTAFSPDGLHVVSIGADGQARLWDAATGAPLREYTGTEGESLWRLAFSPNGRYITAGGVLGNVYVWETASTELVHVLPTENRFVWALTFSPDGTYFAASGSDGIITLWDGREFEAIRRLTSSPKEAIWALTFALDEQSLLSGGTNQEVVRWDVLSGAVELRYRGLLDDGHEDRILSLAVHPNGSQFISGGADGLILLWDIQRNFVDETYFAHEDSVWSLQFSQQQERFLSAGSDGVAIYWDLDRGEILSTLRTGQSEGINAVDFHPTSDQVAIGAADRSIVIRALQGSQILRMPLEHTEDVNDVAFSPDGRTLISAGDSRVLVWDAQFGSLRGELTGHADEVRTVDFHPTLNQAISGSSDASIKRWDLETGEELASYEGVSEAHSGAIWDANFSPDGSQIASAGGDRAVIVWDTETGDVLHRFREHNDVVRAVAFSPDGRYLASGGADELIILYDLQTGAVINRFSGHLDVVTRVDFDPNGEMIASSSLDEQVLIWNMQGDILRRYEGHASEIMSVRYSPDGSSLLSAGRDNTLYLWRADSLSELRQWTLENRGVRTLSCRQMELYQMEPPEGCDPETDETLPEDPENNEVQASEVETS